MTTARQLHTTALSLPEAEESRRRGRPSYTVRGRPFAALEPVRDDGAGDGDRVRLWLSPESVAELTGDHPDATEVTHAGAVSGATIALAQINGMHLNRWVREAWKHRAPARLVAAARAAERAEPGSGDLPRGIGRPATRALAQADIGTLDQVAEHSKAHIAGLHGVGPKAVDLLAAALHDRGLRFR